MKFGRKFVLIFMMIGSAGCSSMIANLHKTPYDAQTQKRARQLLEFALHKYPAPETFKGIGNIKIIKEGHVENGRIAWMASGADKLRIELLTPYGQPWASFSSDGQHIYILVHTDQHYYKKVPSDSGLKQIISISVQPEEIISLLSGQPPVIEYSFISLIESKTAPGPVLFLQKKWWGGYQKIYLNETADHIRSVEVYDGSGKLKYKADLLLKTENDNRIPYRLDISDGMGTKVQLVVNRHWAEVDISPSAFVLAPPGG
jgi:outer membrane biogenesis lipoprotein LolB